MKGGRMNIAVILAGGIGSRFGAKIPKQFVEVFGRPVLAYTVEVFQKHPEIDVIEIVCVESYMNYLKDVVKKYQFSKVRWMTKGGSDFQRSVMNGITKLDGFAKNEDIILIHYGASPFVSDEIITDAISVCRQKGNSTSATPCYLLTGSNDDGIKYTKWVDRDKIMQLNSPQCFKFGYVKQLYQEAEGKGILDKVEPHTISLMYQMGRTIYFSKGDQTNIKITTEEDLKLFKAYVFYLKADSD